MIREALFLEIKPTWNILKFDEEIPVVDADLVKQLAIERQTFVCEAIIGECLVFRKIEVSKEDEQSEKLTFKEQCRYVFWMEHIFLETRDKRIIDCKVEDIDTQMFDVNCYGWVDLDNGLLYQSFLKHVKIVHKEEMVRVLQFVKSGYCKLSLKVFTEIYSKMMETKGLDENIPERIIHELHNREHNPYVAVKIEKDLTVVADEVHCDYLEVGEPIRAYFDKERGYFFRKNIVTNKWQSEDTYTFLFHDYRNINRNRLTKLDKNIFDGTCMEQYAKYSVDRKYPGEHMINYGVMLAQAYFLSAEQAGKMEMNLSNLIIENIYEGWLKDPVMSLPEVFGVTGAQLKFLDKVLLPRRLDEFAQCMHAEDFKEYFPDVKKRIFAVAFYLSGRSPWSDNMEVSKEEIFEAAPTLNSLEKSNLDKMHTITWEYRDYLKMCRRYREYVMNISEDDSAYQVVTALGEVSVNIKPSKIRDAHAKLWQMMDMLQSAHRIKKYTAAIEERKEKEAENFEYTNGKYSILMPKDAADIIREGCELYHCVGSAGYVEAMADNQHTILFLRNNQEPDKPFITMDVCEGRIVQCYGYRNSCNTDIEARDFIMKYAELHHYKIDAVIYEEK